MVGQGIEPKPEGRPPIGEGAGGKLVGKPEGAPGNPVVNSDDITPEPIPPDCRNPEKPDPDP